MYGLDSYVTELTKRITQLDIMIGQEQFYSTIRIDADLHSTLILLADYFVTYNSLINSYNKVNRTLILSYSVPIEIYLFNEIVGIFEAQPDMIILNGFDREIFEIPLEYLSISIEK